MLRSSPTAPSDDIEVISLKPLSGHGNLRAYATVSVGGIEIRGFRIVQEPNRRPIFGMPQLEYTRRNGERGYYPLIAFLDKALQRAIRQVVLDAWHQTTEEESHDHRQF